MRIDAHQHVWSLARGDYGWLTPALGVIHRDFGIADLRPLLAAGRIDRTILVQAAATEAETLHMLAVAAAHPDVVAGVVGWVDFDADDAEARIAAMAARPGLVGLRPMIQDIPDPDWMLSDRVGRALDAMARHGLVFDALVKPPHLANLVRILDEHPALSVVLDHLGKPDVAGDGFAPWAAAIDRLAAAPNLVAKLSGVVTEAAPGRLDAVPRYLAHAIRAFGAERLMFGSDWPVVLLASDYAAWLAMAEAAIADLDPAARAAVMGGTAARTYLAEGRQSRC